MSTKNTPKTEPKILMATDDQIGHIKGLIDKCLRALTREQAQVIIHGGDVYIPAFEEMLQRVLAELTDTFTIIVKRVDYTRDPHEVIRATNRAEYINNDVVATMPRLRKGVYENVPVTFFRIGKTADVVEWERAFEARNLVPDPYAQAAANEQEPSLADTKPNGTFWDRDGKVHNYLAFYRWNGDRRNVNCFRNDLDWNVYWWCAGAPQVLSPSGT